MQATYAFTVSILFMDRRLGIPPNSQAAWIGASPEPKSKENSGLISVAIVLHQGLPITAPAV